MWMRQKYNVKYLCSIKRLRFQYDSNMKNLYDKKLHKSWNYTKTQFIIWVHYKYHTTVKYSVSRSINIYINRICTCLNQRNKNHMRYAFSRMFLTGFIEVEVLWQIVTRMDNYNSSYTIDIEGNTNESNLLSILALQLQHNGLQQRWRTRLIVCRCGWCVWF